MRNRIILATFILFSLTLIAKAQNPNTWQMSQTASVELGIRNSQGAVEPYEADFIVTTPDGKKFTRTIVVEGKEWGMVSFPEDFDTYPRTGRFSWVCVVNGEKVLRGQFRLLLNAARSSFESTKSKLRIRSYSHRRRTLPSN
jgi:hypothetical protein